MPSVIEILVTETRGSAPREAGARMWVSAAETRGTIGGGNLEYTALKIARDAAFRRDAARAPLRARRFPRAMLRRTGRTRIQIHSLLSGRKRNTEIRRRPVRRRPCRERARAHPRAPAL